MFLKCQTSSVLGSAKGSLPFENSSYSVNMRYMLFKRVFKCIKTKKTTSVYSSPQYFQIWK